MLDLSIPGRDGADLLRDLAGGQFAAPILLISGLTDSALDSAELLGAQYGLNVFGSLTKPLSLPALNDALTAATADRQEGANGILQSAWLSGQLITSFAPVLRLESKQCIVAGVRAGLLRLHSGTYLSAQAGTGSSQSQMRRLRSLIDTLLLETVTQMTKWREQGLSLFTVVTLSAPCPRRSAHPGSRRIAWQNNRPWSDQDRFHCSGPCLPGN